MTLINQTQNKLHHLSQFLAAFSNSYLPKEDDDSQSNIDWSIEKTAVVSRTVKGIHIELNFKELLLTIVSKDSRDELDVLGLKKDDIDSWLRTSLERLGFEKDLFNYDVGFTLDTPHDLFLDLDKETEACISNLIEHRNWSQISLENIADGKSVNATEIRVWPHHFDTGMLIDLSEKKDLSVGLGLGYAIADTTASKIPYFYVYGWGKESIDYKNLTALKEGHWAFENWKGAVLPANTSINSKIVEDFYQEASTILTNKLR